MQQHGPHLLTRKVGIKSDLDNMIICATKLPAPDEVVDGTVMQLTGSQPGYTCTHFYRCEYDDQGARWIDITNDCGPRNRKNGDSKSEYAPHCEYEVLLGVVDEFVGEWTSGYLCVWWTPLDVPEDHLAGKLQYDLLVRKLNDYPVSPTDGQLIVRRDATSSVVYDEDHPYKFDDMAYGTEFQSKFYYRLFHVFSTGWYAYTDGPTIVIEKKQ